MILLDTTNLTLTALIQMSGTPDVLLSLHPPPHHQVSYPVLIPNSHGLNSFLDLLHTHPQLQACPGLSEIAIFTAASDAFCLANTNCTVSASLSRLAPVVATALSHGLRVRGYVSTVIACPFTGPVNPARVREVVEKLVEMGCYEVSLGDTVGTGTPATVRALLEEVGRTVPMGMIAGHVSGLTSGSGAWPIEQC
jgi:hydroxymethylglutaryl-CoA lyase